MVAKNLSRLLSAAPQFRQAGCGLFFLWPQRTTATQIRKGTKIIVQKPSGEVTQHACKDDCLFHAFEKVSELKTLQFKRDGFVVTVAAADVVEVSFKCPQCEGKSEVEGLCEGCRARWRPGR